MTSQDQAALVYLTGFLKRNPQILETAYGGIDSDVEEIKEIQAYSEDPANWEMFGPRPPIEDDYSRNGRMGVYDDGVEPNHYCEPTNSVPIEDVALMRYFRHLDETSDCGFNLLQLKTGEFRVGMLADNWPE